MHDVTRGHPEQNRTKNLHECMKCSCCEINRPVGLAQQVLQLVIKVVSHNLTFLTGYFVCFQWCFGWITDLWLHYVGGGRRSPDSCLPGGPLSRSPSLQRHLPLCALVDSQVLWCAAPWAPLSTWGWGRAAGSKGGLNVKREQRWSKWISFTGVQSDAVKLDQAAYPT